MVDAERKNQVWNEVLRQLNHRVEAARARFNALQESLESEGKSTAGDKHETGRAMVQQEMERAAAEVNQAEELLRQITRSVPNTAPAAQWGSWVVLDSGEVVIAVALGAIELPWGRVQVISPAAPLARALMESRAEAGTEVQVNGRTLRVQSVI